MPRKDRTALERAVTGGLRSAIHDHGPITPDMITSAVKRVVGNLKNAAEESSSAAAELGRQRWKGVSAEARHEHAKAAAEKLWAGMKTKKARSAFGKERVRGYWSRMTPDERAAEMSRRRRKGLRKKV